MGQNIHEFLIDALLETSPEVLAQVRENRLAAAPARLTADDMPWTVEEVERVFINGYRASLTLPDTERKYLANIAPGRASEWQWGDDIESWAERQAHIAEKREWMLSHKHHIDQFEDTLIWFLWIPRPHERKLVKGVIEQKAKGRRRIMWRKVQASACLWGLSDDTLRRHYDKALRRLSEHLTKVRYPRRFAAGA